MRMKSLQVENGSEAIEFLKEKREKKNKQQKAPKNQN
jgi:hypothetical protein